MEDVFFLFSKLLPGFLYPLPLGLLVLGAGACLIRQRGLRRGLWAGVGLLWILSTPAWVNLVVEAWEPPRRDPDSLTGVYDWAVVLGGLSAPELSQKGHVELSSRAERLISAVTLYRQGRVKKILITSGSADPFDQSIKEADALGQLALDLGVGPQDLILERRSRNTYENAKFTKEILDQGPGGRGLLITSAFHMPRSQAVFQRQGMNLEPYPVDTLREVRSFPFSALPDPGSLDRFQIIVKEWVGILVYGVLDKK